MKDFTFFNPTRIEFGKAKEENIGRYLGEYACKKVLIVYGSERIKSNGLFERVSSSLKGSNIDFIEVGGVVSNPLLSKVQEAIAIAKANSVDSVLAIGGGSVLDSVKSIAAGAKYDGDVWDFFSGKTAVQDALPLFSIMTLAATGSEMNLGAVLSKEETKEKKAVFSPFLFPKISIINPELMGSVPNNYLAYSAVDIFAHCLDLYFSATHMPNFTKMFIESILKTVMSTTETLLENGDDYTARGDFAWAAGMALNGLTMAGTEGGTYPSHIIEHAMSAQFNVPHGAGLAVVMPAWMRWHKEKNLAQYERFAKEIFNVEGANEGIDQLESWFKKIGAPITLEELNIPRDAISSLAESGAEGARKWGQGEVYSLESITEILNLT